MSINLFSLAWQVSFPGKPAKKLVLLSLADSTNSAHDYTWPSYDTIARRCGISRRAVINSINEMEAEGIVTRAARYRADGNRTSNIFRLNIATLRQLADANADAFYTPEMPTPSELSSPPLVNSVHYPSELSSPPLVNSVHYPSELSSPKPESNQNLTRKGTGEGNGANAPATRPVASPMPGEAFQPVPESVRSQKRRAGVEDIEGDIAATAPAAVRMLTRLSGYWPGADVSDALVARFGDVPDEVALTRAVELWRLSGNKPTNWLGIADWYDELRRDLDWTPQARFKKGNGGTVAPSRNVSKPAPGSQPVTW